MTETGELENEPGELDPTDLAGTPDVPADAGPAVAAPEIEAPPIEEEHPATESAPELSPEKGQTPRREGAGQGVEVRKGRSRILGWPGAAALMIVVVALGMWLFGPSRSDDPTGATGSPGVRVAAISAFEMPQGDEPAEFPTLKVPGFESRRGNRREKQPPASTSASVTAPASPTALSRSGVFPARAAALDLSRLAAWVEPAAILFAKKGYKGRSSVFSVGEVSHLRGTNIGENSATSVMVVGGARLTLWGKPEFAGREETFTTDCPKLSRRTIRNNRASSLRVAAPALGPRLWTFGPVKDLDTPVMVEGYRNGIALRREDAADGEHAVYLFRDCVLPTDEGLDRVTAQMDGLAAQLGRPLTGGVSLFDGALAAQLHENGIVLYDAATQRAWYHLNDSAG